MGLVEWRIEEIEPIIQKSNPKTKNKLQIKNRASFRQSCAFGIFNKS